MLKQWRKKAGLTQKELAEKVGVSQNMVSYWERGNYQPNAKTMLKLAEVLNVDCETILKCFISEEEAK